MKSIFNQVDSEHPVPGSSAGFRPRGVLEDFSWVLKFSNTARFSFSRGFLVFIPVDPWGQCEEIKSAVLRCITWFWPIV